MPPPTFFTQKCQINTFLTIKCYTSTRVLMMVRRNGMTEFRKIQEKLTGLLQKGEKPSSNGVVKLSQELDEIVVKYMELVNDLGECEEVK